ncbi:hypothetical protein [Cohnella panacarvi]|uniref:hypothetical protein n=1 Tax=Cohnella panacarvi TaxID=400776 RepID=UPI00047AB716|nr:hypothetical protein [Cohnella panacarvi]
MPCHIGRIIIVKNEGTVIIGNVGSVAPADTSTTNEGSGEEMTGEELKGYDFKAKPASSLPRSRS